jgi:ribosome biogenesis GTPase YqeH
MINKCTGCGVELQDKNKDTIGYTENTETSLLCQRCFRIKHYSDYKTVSIDSNKYIDILKSINTTNDLVLYIVDLMNMPEDINMIKKYLNNRMILVLNKRDLLPLSTNDNKLIEYFKNKYLDIIVVSAEKNYNIDLLLEKIKEYQTSKYVYIVGTTNAGKSTLINKLIYNYSDKTSDITTSPMSSTTLDLLEIKLDNNITLVDTPGLIEKGNIVDSINPKLLKKIVPKKEIKPIVYQIYEGQSLVIDNIMRIDYIKGNKNSFIVYMSNSLNIKKVLTSSLNINNLSKKELTVNNEDIVISGLGWIKIIEEAKVNIFILDNVKIFKRKPFI